MSASFLKRHASQGIRFVVVGSLGAIVDLGSLHLMVVYGGMSPYVAQTISTLLAVTLVFILNKFFTFRSKQGKVTGEIVRFALVYGVAFLSNVALTSLFLWLGVQYLIAKCLAIGIGIVWNYCMSHGFIFKKKDRSIVEEAAVV